MSKRKMSLAEINALREKGANVKVRPGPSPKRPRQDAPAEKPPVTNVIDFKPIEAKVDGLTDVVKRLAGRLTPGKKPVRFDVIRDRDGLIESVVPVYD